MKSRNFMLGVAALAFGLVPALAQDDAKIFYGWAPKPVPLTQWKAPNKPIWRLSEIMAAHGGELVISSVPSRGTTMSLRFPEATATTRSPQLDLQAH